MRRMDTTIAKGLRLLDRIAHADAPIGVTAMAKEMGLEKSNVHRTLKTLLALGYVRKDGATGRYEPTLKVWEIGMQVFARHSVVRAARPFMQMLHQQTQETVHLTILDGADCIYLDQIRAPVPVRTAPSPGRRAPALFPASGRVQLAFEPNVEDIINDFRATHPRGKEIEVAATLKEFAIIRQQGVTFTESGWSHGINSIAGAIIGRDGTAAAAIAVSGPTERLTRERMEGLRDPVLNACTQASDTLRAP
jgi:IclR family transcriptional regulator, KDG regulon repressor